MMPAETEVGEDIPSGPTALYRCYAEDGSLLYVGVTDDLRGRLGGHERQKPWWPEVARKTVAWYDSRLDGEQAEAAAINDEHPVHNVRSHSMLLGRVRVPREALKVDVPAELRLMRRLHSYRLDHGVDLRDQVAVAVDQWLHDHGY
jgi:predicted GIY-YIG superfamily endonuclease